MRLGRGCSRSEREAARPYLQDRAGQVYRRMSTRWGEALRPAVKAGGKRRTALQRGERTSRLHDGQSVIDRRPPRFQPFDRSQVPGSWTGASTRSSGVT